MVSIIHSSIHMLNSRSIKLLSVDCLHCYFGWTAFNSRCFLYVPRVLNWAQAERNCQSMGGNLASALFLIKLLYIFFLYCNGNGRGRRPPT
uniref:C-type lectin domain-containing protein n=1 Tax=Dicentrarchus labrax TaxID=13489 RepID=A0A8P4GQF2_DICLA